MTKGLALSYLHQNCLSDVLISSGASVNLSEMLH